VPNDAVRKIILILSTVPIAILANCFRVLALVLGAYYFGVDRIEGLFHDATGLALWVFALILFFLLDRALVVVGLLIHRALAFEFWPRSGAA
jgi:exosortase/archaeosortase family protein